MKTTTKFNPEKDMIIAEPDKRRYLVIKKKHVKILQPLKHKGGRLVLVKDSVITKPYFDVEEIDWEELKKEVTSDEED